MSLTDQQKFRAARAILDWTQMDLANRAGMSHTSISNFEKGVREMMHNNKMACWKAFADNGVLFNCDTIRYQPQQRRPPVPKKYEAIRDKLIAKKVPTAEAKTRAAKIFNSTRKKGAKPVTRYSK